MASFPPSPLAPNTGQGAGHRGTLESYFPVNPILLHRLQGARNIKIFFLNQIKLLLLLAAIQEA